MRCLVLLSCLFSSLTLSLLDYPFLSLDTLAPLAFLSLLIVD